MTSFISFLEILVASFLGVKSTYLLTHRFRMNSIRAASLASLVFIALAYVTKFPPLQGMQAAFFGSTYVAMSEPHRLKEVKVMFAGIVFAIVFFILDQTNLLHSHGGIGGTLGSTAFAACMVVYFAEFFWFQLHGKRS